MSSSPGGSRVGARATRGTRITASSSPNSSSKSSPTTAAAIQQQLASVQLPEYEFESDDKKVFGLQKLNDALKFKSIVLCSEFDSVGFDESGERGWPLWMGMVNRGRLPEPKKPKTMKRILVIGKYRMFFIQKGRLRTKIVRNFHFLELVDITQQEKTKAAITFQATIDRKKRPLQGFTIQSASVPAIIQAIRIAYLRITCGFPSEFGFTLRAPDDLLLPLDDRYLQMDPEVVGPANGFIETYLAQCNLLKVEANSQVVQFICDLFAKGITELNLSLCPGFEPKSTVRFDLEPIIGAMAHNTYFRSIRLDDVARKEAVHAVMTAIRFNQTLTKITLSYLPELSIENCMELRNAVINNSECIIQMFDFHGTSISTKGAEHLATALESLQHALHTLVMSECSVGSKGMQNIINALSRNFGVSLGLQILDLSRNKFDEASSKCLETWLEKAATNSNLRKLLMSECGSNMDLTFTAKPLRNLVHLQELDISHNKVDDGITQLIRVALEDSKTLQILNLQDCSLSGYNAAAILTALVTNKNLQNTQINLGENHLGKDEDSGLLATAIGKSMNIHTLNLSKNKFKAPGLAAIIHKLGAGACVQSINTLILDNAVDVNKELHAVELAKALIALINPSTSPLRVLSIAGGFNKVVIHLLDFMSVQAPLVEVNLSDNKMGDTGAVALSEMLRENVNLRVLKCDGNGITLTGWVSFLSLFMYNHTLQWMEHPWQDYNKAYASYASNSQGERKREKLRETLLSIQRAVESNNVALRGWFPVEEALDPPAMLKTEVAPVEVTPLLTVPAELQQFSNELTGKDRHSDQKKKKIPEADGPLPPPPPDKSFATGVQQGYLTVQTSVGWKLRWCVLKDDNVLYYWKTQLVSWKKPVGKIPVGGAKVGLLATEGVRKAFCIEIHTNQRTFFVHAENKAGMDIWLGSLKKAASDGGAQTPASAHPTTISVASQASYRRQPGSLPDSGSTISTIGRLDQSLSAPVSGGSPTTTQQASLPAPPSAVGQRSPTTAAQQRPVALARSAPVAKPAKQLIDSPPPLPSREDKGKNVDDSPDEEEESSEEDTSLAATMTDNPPDDAPPPPPARDDERPVPPTNPATKQSLPIHNTTLRRAKQTVRRDAASVFSGSDAAASTTSDATVTGTNTMRGFAIAPPGAMGDWVPPPPPPAAPPPPPTVNIAKAYIPRKKERTLEQMEETLKSGGTLTSALSGQISLAMSQRRGNLREDDYECDSDSSDWDSDGEG